MRFLLPAVIIVASLAPVLRAQEEPSRDLLMKRGGANAESEAGVARGLAWLSRQQTADGHWEFDGTSKDQAAATGIALLPFLGAGEDHKNAVKYQKTVAKALQWLLDKQGKDGSVGTADMYAHAIATMALCEAAWRADDAKVKEKAADAVNFIVRAQGANGSWGYFGLVQMEGDTSIVGWQIQALSAAKRAGIAVDDKVFKQADKFLMSVSTDGGAKYGYREKGASQTLTPVGLLSRNSMGKLDVTDKAFANGIDFLKQYPPKESYLDMYYYYYATQVAFRAGGDNWHKFWNPKMRDLLIDLQNKGGGDETRGSWDKDGGYIGTSCGKLGTTALAILTLEVYYRFPAGGDPKRRR
ncbi:MAG TPA: prenyltransferase/squalene oxidase repeat-containing protein [Gemmataceae bacterium]|nr:prenyltransferase/squalene oxidase repeat-containing protein [Gemmataceae bacterium]